MSINNLAKGLVPIVLATVAAAWNCDRTAEIERTTGLETISGVPLSVEINDTRTGHTMGIVIEGSGYSGRREVLAYSGIYFSDSGILAEVMIKAEIADGDLEPIELTGKHYTDRSGNRNFQFRTIDVNGYHFELDSYL